MTLYPYQIIRIKREDLGITQEVFAEKIGMNASAYSKIETGYTQITTDRLKKIAEILGVKMADLLGEKPKEINEKSFEYGKTLEIIQTAFEFERNAYISQIEIFKKTIDFLQKQLENK